MVELITVPSRRAPETMPKVPLEVLVGRVIDYLKDHPQGETVEGLANILDISNTNIKKILGIIATVVAKVTPFYLENVGARVRLLLTRSPKGAVTAARFEMTSPGPEGELGDSTPTPGQKPSYVMKPGDISEVQRVWKLYKATGRAFRREEATRLNELREKFPYFFTTNPAKTGILPTMALFTVAKTLEEYACLGRLPDAIEIPVAIVTFEGGT